MGIIGRDLATSCDTPYKASQAGMGITVYLMLSDLLFWALPSCQQA